MLEEWFERVAGVVSEPFEHGTEEGPALYIGAEADERPPRCGVVVRWVREAQVREEVGAEGSSGNLFRLGDHGVVVDSAEGFAQPFDAGARGVLAAEDVVVAGHVCPLRVTLVPDLGVRERTFERQEDRLGGTERVEHGALLRDAYGQGAADVVVAAGRGGVWGHGTEERTAGPQGCEEIFWDTHLLE